MSAALAPKLNESGALDGEFAFSRRNFNEIAERLYALSGIHLTDTKMPLVYSRLAKRLRKIGCPDFDAYCALIRSKEGESELSDMVAALTTNLTKFFREPHHFEHLRRDVMPRLAAAARAGQRVRLWSAACSSGEEAYSMAMCVLQELPDAHRYDVKMLATDIDKNMIATARAGAYNDDAVAPIPTALRERWMTRNNSDKSWHVRSELRTLIAFNEMNLIAPWPIKGRFDVIFCRNVVIYFDDRTQSLLWSRFREALVTSGFIYIGHSERIEDDQGFETDGLTTYKKVGR